MQQTRTANGTIMPLLMGCTQPSKIQTLENEQPVIYDPESQKVVMDLRIVGTKSLKTGRTKPGRTINEKLDQKNEIDDSKNV